MYTARRRNYTLLYWGRRQTAAAAAAAKTTVKNCCTPRAWTMWLSIMISNPKGLWYATARPAGTVYNIDKFVDAGTTFTATGSIGDGLYLYSYINEFAHGFVVSRSYRVFIIVYVLQLCGLLRVFFLQISCIFSLEISNKIDSKNYSSI